MFRGVQHDKYIDKYIGLHFQQKLRCLAQQWVLTSGPRKVTVLTRGELASGQLLLP